MFITPSFKKSLIVEQFQGNYLKRSAVHNGNTRGCNNFVIPRCRLSMGQRAFYFRGPREWNGPPDKKLVFLSGHYNMFYTKQFWRYFNDFEYILNLIKLL